ncbi:MAG: hypothetical protein ACRCY9_18630, partial [Phycicoccus sp.]
IFSAAQGGELRIDGDGWAEYLWRVLSSPVRFADLLAESFSDPDRTLVVDLSATGSVAASLRRGAWPERRVAFAIDQFGADVRTFGRLCAELAAARAPVSV